MLKKTFLILVVGHRLNDVSPFAKKKAGDG